jgi:tellurite resistance protein
MSTSEEEERYFARQNADARERIRQELEASAKKAADARAMAETLGTDREAVIARLQAMGFDADKVQVFDLLPLVYVAWADGTVQQAERRAILEVLQTRGIAPDSEPWLLIEALLETRPSDTFLQEMLSLLQEIVGESADRADDILGYCEKVAGAHGPLFGLLGTVSAEEKDVMARIARALGR